MGEIIRKKVKAMNWKAKIALVLCFTLIFSTFMYQGWYKPKPAHAAVTVYKGTFTKRTSTGTQSITGVGFQPKAVIFFWTKNTTNGTSSANGVMGIGFAGGSPIANSGVVTSAQDNVGTTNTGWRESATYSIITLNATTNPPTLAAQASVTSFDADGFTLNWQTADASADIIHFIALGGTDITNVKVGQFTGPVATGNFSYTGVGFQPDLVMLAFPDRTATTLDAVQAAGALNIGMFTSTSQGAIGWGSRAGQTTITHAHTLSDAHSIYGIRRNAADQIATFTSMDASGFTLNYSTVGGQAPYIYIALQGGQYKIGSFSKNTSAGTQSVTGVGFQPTGLMLFSHNSTATNGTVETADPAASMSIGAASGPAVNGTVWMHDKSIINTDVNMISHNNLVMRMGASNNGITDYGQASLSSFDTNGFTLNWSSSDATARRILYLAIGSSTPADTTPPVAGTVTVSPDVSGYTSSSPTITTQFTDNESAVTSCEYTTNGTTWSAGTLSGSSPTWTCTANPAGLSGTLTINMRATSSGGTGTGTAISRTVDSTAPTDGTLSATAGNTQVSLSWSGFSDGQSGLSTTDSYKLVYSTTGFPNTTCSNGTEITAVTTQTSYTHTGLTNGTTYYYRLCAIDSIGNISSGVTASATPQAAPVPGTTTGAMTFPTVTSSSIQVQVTFTGDTNSNNSCIIKYGTSPGSYPNTAPAPTRGSGTYTTTVTGLNSSTMYYFQATFSDPDGVTGTNPLTGQQATSSSYTNDPMLHNSTNLSSNYWSANGGWGIPGGKYGAFVCDTCHTPRATNIKGIKSTISTPDGSNWASSGTPSVTVNFQSYTTAATAMGNDNETRTSSTRICEVCHSQTTYHKYSQSATAHNGVVDCTNCHKHNAAFAGDGPCMSCHNSAQNVLYNTRQVVGAGGDFVKLSRHVSNGTSTEIVTNYDCVVCHAEGDATKVAAGTGWIDKSKHKNGTTNTGDPTTDRMVKLRNVDNISVTYNFSKNVLTKAVATAAQKEQMRTDLDTFCLNCHDSDGASAINVNGTTGLNLNNTRALTPFNTNDNLRNGRDGFTTRTRVVDVKSQLNPGTYRWNATDANMPTGFNGTNYDGNPSQHAVLGPRYYTNNTSWAATAWVNHTNRAGQVMNTVREKAKLHCSDCHLSETNAHGATNAWHMLLSGTANDYTTDYAMGNVLPSTTASVVCYKCHASAVYGSPGANTSRFNHYNAEKDWYDGGNYGGLSGNGAKLGPTCLNCHGGGGFGDIHGASGTYNPTTPTFPPSGTTYTRQRFMPGAWMFWKPGTGGNDNDWNSTTQGSCYFPQSSSWTACTHHAGNPGSKTGITVNYARPTKY